MINDHLTLLFPSVLNSFFFNKSLSTTSLFCSHFTTLISAKARASKIVRCWTEAQVLEVIFVQGSMILCVDSILVFLPLLYL